MATATGRRQGRRAANRATCHEGGDAVKSHIGRAGLQSAKRHADGLGITYPQGRRVPARLWEGRCLMGEGVGDWLDRIEREHDERKLRQAQTKLAEAQLAELNRSDELGEPPATVPSDPLDKQSAAVLRCLTERHPELATLDDVESLADISRRTATAAVRLLIGRGLAHRPAGPNKGVCATPEGLALGQTLRAQIAPKLH